MSSFSSGGAPVLKPRAHLNLSLRSFRLNSPQPLNRLNPKESRERKAKPMKDLQSSSAQVRQAAYDIHLYHGHNHLEMRKLARSQDAARCKSKPTFVLAAVSAFFAV